MRTLSRLLAMSPAELSFRARAGVRTQAERLSVAARRPSWTRRGIGDVLAPTVVDASLRTAIAREDRPEAARLLRDAIFRRPNRFVIDHRHARELSRAVSQRWPGAPAAAARTGDAILAGRHRILGYTTLSFARGGRLIDWHFDPVHQREAPMRFWADVPFLDPSCGDHKIIWEINRQQYFHALGRAFWLTGDRRYATRIADDIQDWLSANPPLLGINWASMLELGFRSLSWVTALHFLLGDPVASPDAPRASATGSDTWLLDVLLGLDRQLTHVERHLSTYFSPNTHLTGEALALYVVGVALPELAASERWARLGKSLLLREIERQIRPDGGHAELSTCYHRYTLDFYNLALVTAEIEGDGNAASAFRDAVQRLSSYLQVFCAADGTIPAIGDDDGGALWALSSRHPRDVRDSLALAAVLTRPADDQEARVATADLPEETLWLAWGVRPAVRESRPPAPAPARPDVALRVHHLRDTGYIVVHTARGDRLTFDVGPHGFLNGGHAHADALSITLSLRAQPFLIDPGTATYTMNAALRTHMRESASHNTLTLDGRSSAVAQGPFHWSTRATATLDALTPNPHFMVAEGTHDGYAPLEHRRLIVHGEETGWLIADFVTGSPATIDAHWHFDPAWHVDEVRGVGLLATGPTGARAWLLHEGDTYELSHGAAVTGWYSPRYGDLVPAFSARVRHTAATAEPLVTWIAAEDEHPEPQIEKVPLTVGATAAYGVRLRHRAGTVLTLLRPATATEPRVTACEGVTTDARVLQMTISHGGGVALSLADASQVTTRGAVRSLSCSDRVTDLHLRVRDGLAELWTTRPPSSLRLSFIAGCADRLFLNGHEVVEPATGGEVVVSASHWGVRTMASTPSESRMHMATHPYITGGRAIESGHAVVAEGCS